MIWHILEENQMYVSILVIIVFPHLMKSLHYVLYNYYTMIIILYRMDLHYNNDANKHY